MNKDIHDFEIIIRNFTLKSKYCYITHIEENNLELYRSYNIKIIGNEIIINSETDYGQMYFNFVVTNREIDDLRTLFNKLKFALFEKDYFYIK